MSLNEVLSQKAEVLLAFRCGDRKRVRCANDRIPRTGNTWGALELGASPLDYDAAAGLACADEAWDLEGRRPAHGGDGGISTWTVHTHVKSLLDKLGVHTRTEAVMKYFQK